MKRRAFLKMFRDSAAVAAVAAGVPSAVRGAEKSQAETFKPDDNMIPMRGVYVSAPAEEPETDIAKRVIDTRDLMIASCSLDTRIEPMHVPYALNAIKRRMYSANIIVDDNTHFIISSNVGDVFRLKVYTPAVGDHAPYTKPFVKSAEFDAILKRHEVRFAVDELGYVDVEFEEVTRS